MENKYVLLVCPILKDGMDIAGNKYIGVGEFIQSKIFIKDGNIDSGLYGILWGECNSLPSKSFMTLNWAVVKTEINENLFFINRKNNEAKFNRGIILHIGKIKSCADFIKQIIHDEQQYFDKKSKLISEYKTIGSEEWRTKLRGCSW
jgi:hypothetical protein